MEELRLERAIIPYQVEGVLTVQLLMGVIVQGHAILRVVYAINPRVPCGVPEITNARLVPVLVRLVYADVTMVTPVRRISVPLEARVLTPMFL